MGLCPCCACCASVAEVGPVFLLWCLPAVFPPCQFHVSTSSMSLENTVLLWKTLFRSLCVGKCCLERGFPVCWGFEQPRATALTSAPVLLEDKNVTCKSNRV